MVRLSNLQGVGQLSGRGKEQREKTKCRIVLLKVLATCHSHRKVEETRKRNRLYIGRVTKLQISWIFHKMLSLGKED